MNSLLLQTDSGQTAFEPGTEISGTAAWQLDQPPGKIELRLFWFTSGMGNKDVGIQETISFDQPLQSDSRPFRMVLPAVPLNFTGQLITLSWALELVTQSCPEIARLEIIIAPGGKPIKLEHVPNVKRNNSFSAFRLPR